MKITKENFGHLVEFNSNDDIKKKVRLEDITTLAEQDGRFYIRVTKRIIKEKTYYISKEDYLRIEKFIQDISEIEKLYKKKRKTQNSISDLEV